MTPPAYGISVCRHCDPVRPEHIGPEVDDICPECGAQLFGLLGTEMRSFRETVAARARHDPTFHAALIEEGQATCECGETTLEDCSTRPTRHCGLWQQQP